MNKDFFDEEYEKKVGNQSSQPQIQPDEWYYYPNATQPPKPTTQTKSKKGLVAFVCLGMVLCLLLGWMLSACGFIVLPEDVLEEPDAMTEEDLQIFAEKVIESLRSQDIDITEEQALTAVAFALGNVTDGTVQTQTDSIGIMLDVFDYLRNNFYEELTNEEWEYAVREAGTALLQAGGDQFSRLLSPQEAYDLDHNSGSLSFLGDSTAESFGITMSTQLGFGISITDIVPDSSVYGSLQEGDLIIKLSNLKAKKLLGVYGNSLVFDKDSSGNWVLVDLTYDYLVTIYGQQELAKNGFESSMLDGNAFVISNWQTNHINTVLANTYSATFSVIRNGDVLHFDLERGKSGLEQDAEHDFNYVQYYYKDSNKNVHTNVSIENQNKATTSTYKENKLDMLPDNVAYVKLLGFDTYNYKEGNTTKTSNTAIELETILKEIKVRLPNFKLVLDVKGNPGGSVDVVRQIAGMLINTDKLNAEQKSQVTRGNQLLITKLVDRDGNSSNYYYPSATASHDDVKSVYSDFFGSSSDKCNIVIWTDGNSASASELLTGCLLDYGTAIQMGTKTYGKGIAQTWEKLDYKGAAIDINNRPIQYSWAVYYTVAKYYSPLGTNIHGTGYTPSQQYNNLSTYSELWTAAANYWAN